MQFGDARLPERFWSKLDPCPITGCWRWFGAMNCKGYGSHGRKAPHSGSGLTHRYTYEIENGAVPDGLEIDHIVCSERSCANPAHMKAVTHRENVARAVKKTHCIRGHELAGENLMRANRGTVARCVACYRMHAEQRCAQKRKDTRDRGPLPTKPKKQHGKCGRGHEMRFTGHRLVCDVCMRVRTNNYRAKGQRIMKATFHHHEGTWTLAITAESANDQTLLEIYADNVSACSVSYEGTARCLLLEAVGNEHATPGATPAKGE